MSKLTLGDRTEKMLLRCESEFITDPQRRAIEHWYDAILTRTVTIDVTRQYALEHRWAERRQAFWRGVQAAWLKQRHIALLEQRRTELYQALELRGQAFELIRPKTAEDGTLVFAVQPKSWEGAVRAFATLDDMVETKREAVMHSIEPMLAEAEAALTSGGGAPVDLPFSRAEMRDVAHNLLAKRRIQRRADLGIEDEDDDEDEDETGDDEGDHVARGDVVRPGQDRGGMAGKK